MNRMFLIVPFLVAALVACGSSDHAGTSTETTNGVAGIVHINNTPLAAAKVSLVRPDGSLSAFSAQSDSTGHFAIEADSGRYHLLVETTDSSAMAWRYDVLTGRDTSISVGADAPGSWKIQGANRNDSICILATPFCAQADAQGVVVFPHLPVAAFTAVLGGRPIASASIVAHDTAQTREFIRQQFILEDFDDGDSRHLLAPLSGGDGWYLVVPSHTILKYPADSQPFGLALVTQNAWKGRSLLVKYSDTAAIPQVPSLQIGLKMADSALDLSTLDSLCFWARGDGLLQVALEQEVTPGVFRKSIRTVTLENEWRQTSLVVSEFKGDSTYGLHVPFRQIGSRIHLLTFFVAEGTELGLDQIRFTGVSAANFTVRR